MCFIDSQGEDGSDVRRTGGSKLRKRKRTAPEAASAEPALHDGRPLVSIVVENSQGDADALGRTIESALDQRWPAVEVLVVDSIPNERTRAVIGDFGSRIAASFENDGRSTAGLEAALAASRGALVSFVDPPVGLRETAVLMAHGFPAFSHFGKGMQEDKYALNERLLLAAEDVLAVAPEGRSVIAVTEGLRVPETLRSTRPVPAFPVAGGHPADDSQAIRELDDLRHAGAGLIAFLWPAYWWLDHYGGFRDHLESTGRRVLENDSVIAFEL